MWISLKFNLNVKFIFHKVAGFWRVTLQTLFHRTLPNGRFGIVIRWAGLTTSRISENIGDCLDREVMVDLGCLKVSLWR